MLLAASCIFYMAFIPVYIFILGITILIDYTAALWIASSEGRKKKLYLIISIISTCLVLFVFKYFNFFNSNFARIASFFHWKYPIEIINIILPIGLSFHTFQSLSYVIEVYRGNQKPERHFGVYALYVMFYPQLVAGPIERPQNLLHQFHEEHFINYSRITDGLKLMAWGMFKKVVIADRLAILVNQVYNDPTVYSGFPLILATVFFSFQIYCDFSGYSDIAIGSAQVMGFRLMDNFNRPYFSKSVAEFWKRWHISLSSWFRDYLYISLGGKKVGNSRWQFNLFFTFLVSGLWHGANWTFVAWGAINGLFLLCSIWTKKLREKIVAVSGIYRFPRFYKYMRVLFVFSLISFAWIFFRAKNISDAYYIITHMFKNLINVNVISKNLLIISHGWLKLTGYEIIISILMILFMEAVHLIQRHGSIRRMLSEKPVWVRWSIYFIITYSIIFFGVFDNTQFIYFQF
jgi:D-alanyl-lipoteichoic acid acyltransferase DltB (MBOAT superfamily)